MEDGFLFNCNIFLLCLISHLTLILLVALVCTIQDCWCQFWILYCKDKMLSFHLCKPGSFSSKYLQLPWDLLVPLNPKRSCSQLSLLSRQRLRSWIRCFAIVWSRLCRWSLTHHIWSHHCRTKFRLDFPPVKWSILICCCYMYVFNLLANLTSTFTCMYI